MLKYIIAIIFLFFGSGVASAIEINQLAYQQIAKSSAVDIQPALVSGTATWSIVLGPEWLSINSSTGQITGTTDAIGEANYVQVKAVYGSEYDIMTFIIIAGAQTVSTMGSGDEDYSTLAGAMAGIAAGDVVLITSGTYADTISETADRVTKNGADAANMTSYICDQPMGCVFSSAYFKGAQFIGFKGLSLTNGLTVDGEDKGGVLANHLKFQMCEVKNNGINSLLGATYVLFEDCIAYGNGRAKLRVGSTGTDSDYIIFRRCVVRNDYFEGSINPCATIMGYGGDNILFQNVIVIDESQDVANFTSCNAKYGAIEAKNNDVFYVLDSIVLNNYYGSFFGDTGTTGVRITNTAFIDVGTGSRINSSDTIFDNVTIYTVDAQSTANTFDDVSGSVTAYFTDSIFQDITGTGATAPPNLTAKMILYQMTESTNNMFYSYGDLTIGDTTDIIDGTDPGIVYPVRVETGSAAETNGVGAEILLRRGTYGTYYGQTGYNTVGAISLWPFPNEDQIHDQMQAFTYVSGVYNVDGNRGFAVDGQTLTTYIWEYLGGVIPDEIYGFSTVATHRGGGSPSGFAGSMQ
jgi:hypothetical protein